MLVSKLLFLLGTHFPKRSDQALNVLEWAQGAWELQMTSFPGRTRPSYTTEEGASHPTCPLPNGTTCLTGPVPSFWLLVPPLHSAWLVFDQPNSSLTKWKPLLSSYQILPITHSIDSIFPLLSQILPCPNLASYNNCKFRNPHNIKG